MASQTNGREPAQSDYLRIVGLTKSKPGAGNRTLFIKFRASSGTV